MYMFWTHFSHLIHTPRITRYIFFCRAELPLPDKDVGKCNAAETEGDEKEKVGRTEKGVHSTFHIQGHQPDSQTDRQTDRQTRSDRPQAEKKCEPEALGYKKVTETYDGVEMEGVIVLKGKDGHFDIVESESKGVAKSTMLDNGEDLLNDDQVTHYTQRQ